MKKKLIKAFIIYGIVFTVLFVCRLIYGLFMDNSNIGYYYGTLSSQSLYHNVASAEVNLRTSENTKDGIYQEQKYEKVALIDSLTDNYEEDIDTVRNIIDFYGALIQSENIVENDR